MNVVKQVVVKTEENIFSDSAIDIIPNINYEIEMFGVYKNIVSFEYETEVEIEEIINFVKDFNEVNR